MQVCDRNFHLGEGLFSITGNAPSKCCLFCNHCTDVFWDYTHGPYAYACDIEADTSLGHQGECDKFEET